MVDQVDVIQPPPPPPPDKPVYYIIHAGEKSVHEHEGVMERLHDFEKRAMEELHEIEHQIINHHSAAFILIAVFVLGILSAYMIATEERPTLTEASSGTCYVSGYVTSEDGEPLEGVTISMAGGTTQTNQDGYYFFGERSLGTYEISASAPSYRVLVKKIYLSGEGSEMVNFMLEDGSGTDYVDDLPPPTPLTFWTLNILLAAFFTMMSTLSLAGAFLCYQGKRFKITMICATASVLTFGFVAGSVLGLFALAFVMLSKNDFDDAPL